VPTPSTACDLSNAEQADPSDTSSQYIEFLTKQSDLLG